MNNFKEEIAGNIAEHLPRRPIGVSTDRRTPLPFGCIGVASFVQLDDLTAGSFDTCDEPEADADYQSASSRSVTQIPVRFETAGRGKPLPLYEPEYPSQDAGQRDARHATSVETDAAASRRELATCAYILTRHLSLPDVIGILAHAYVIRATEARSTGDVEAAADLWTAHRTLQDWAREVVA